MAKKRTDFSSLDDEKLTLADVLGVTDSFSQSAGRGEASSPVEEAPPSASSVDLKAPLRISIERRGRGGKTVTKLMGLAGAPLSLQAFLKDLKKSLGCGASIEADAFLFQGDQRERLCELLKSRGAVNVKSS